MRWQRSGRATGRPRTAWPWPGAAPSRHCAGPVRLARGARGQPGDSVAGLERSARQMPCRSSWASCCATAALARACGRTCGRRSRTMARGRRTRCGRRASCATCSASACTRSPWRARCGIPAEVLKHNGRAALLALAALSHFSGRDISLYALGGKALPVKLRAPARRLRRLAGGSAPLCPGERAG